MQLTAGLPTVQILNGVSEVRNGVHKRYGFPSDRVHTWSTKFLQKYIRSLRRRSSQKDLLSLENHFLFSLSARYVVRCLFSDGKGHISKYQRLIPLNCISSKVVDSFNVYIENRNSSMNKSLENGMNMKEFILVSHTAQDRCIICHVVFSFMVHLIRSRFLGQSLRQLGSFKSGLVLVQVLPIPTRTNRAVMT